MNLNYAIKLAKKTGLTLVEVFDRSGRNHLVLRSNNQLLDMINNGVVYRIIYNNTTEEKKQNEYL